ncbi:hypothetical protein [Acidithiobacillus sp.]|uniref:hypothetical protein n=1 Tax=Acidithiobacillus sp. TaxID=1872118 RepID=UPI003D08A8BA
MHDRVLVKFNAMNWRHRTIPITATAITLATARTALATSVNRHTLYRYGWLIGASLLQGAIAGWPSRNGQGHQAGKSTAGLVGGINWRGAGLDSGTLRKYACGAGGGDAGRFPGAGR